MPDTIRRRVRRSMFSIRSSLLGLAMSARTTDGQLIPRSTLKGFLLTAGIGAAVGAAYLAFRKPDESLEELPGKLEKAADDETRESIDASKGTNDKLKDHPSDNVPAVKPIAEDKGFWAKTKEAMSPSKPVNGVGPPTPPAAIAKPPDTAVGAPPAPSKVVVPSVVPTTGSVAKGTTVGAAASGLTSLPKGYRIKRQFSGFKDAEKISSKDGGTFTEYEAQQLISLKASKAQTSGFSKVPEAIATKITSYANKHGVDPDLALKMARIESGGNPNAISSTGAIGVYQFVGGTATGMGISNRFDEDQNIEGGVLLIKQNMRGLPSDIPPTAINLYLYHQLGAGGAPELIRGARDGKRISEMSPRLQKQLGVNIGAGNATAAGYIESNRVALEGRPVTVAKASPPKSVPVPESMVVPVKMTAKESVVTSSSSGTSASIVENSQEKPLPKPQTVVKTKNGILIGA